MKPNAPATPNKARESRTFTCVSLLIHKQTCVSKVVKMIHKKDICINNCKIGTYAAYHVHKMAKIVHDNVVMIKNWQKVYMRA